MKIWSDKNEKLVEIFFALLWRAKKGVPNFSPTVAFFRRGGTETVKFAYKHQFFRNIGLTILQIWSDKRGGGGKRHTLSSPR